MEIESINGCVKCNKVNTDLQVIVKFTHSLIDKYEIQKIQLAKNMELYDKLSDAKEYSKALTDWSRVHLFLFDLKDSLCRIGIDID